jgi:hypothetical protein
LSSNVGKSTLRTSIHRSGLNFKLPSLSNNKSFVNLAQYSPIVPDRMEQVVKVTLVLDVIEVTFGVARWLEDETGLEENLTG